MHWASSDGSQQFSAEPSDVAAPEPGLQPDAPSAADGRALLVWAAFAAVVPLLVALDYLFLGERRRDEVSMSTASWQCAFWIGTGLTFNVFILFSLGVEEGISWLSGYVLEYMLSVDNLFCFHLIFITYSTPKDQTHRALVYGIGGAVILRFLLFALGAQMFNTTRLFHWLFGLILLYSGIKVITISEEGETDHKQNWAVRQIARVLPVHDGYAPNAAFFLHVGDLIDVTPQDETPQPAENCSLALRGDTARDLEFQSCPGSCTGDGHGQAASTAAPRSPVKVTLLFLVVVTLWAVDLIFALDSVAAKVSMVSQFENQVDLVINFTSSAFTMLTLRSLYFLLASLVHIFRLIKYGVGLILVLIGLRLMLSAYISVSEGVFCAIMLGIFGLSILASMVAPLPEVPAAASSTELATAMTNRPTAVPS